MAALKADPDWIAIDWGTSNVRAWGVDANGSVMFERRSDRGMGTLEPSDYPSVVHELLSDITPEGPALDVLICGMAGAKQGWMEAPYLPTPADLRELGARAVVPPLNDPRFSPRILSGVCQNVPGQEDVMRGEETQVLGYCAGKPDYSGPICLPGTHSKWVEVEDFAITRFSTVMTGELFDVLRKHSVLRHTAGAATGETDQQGFSAGLHSAFEEPDRLTGQLFGARAASLVSGCSAEWAAGYLSGLLIGAELAAHKDRIDNAALPLIGSAGLCALYGQALDQLGIAFELVDGKEATLAGLTRARLNHQ